MNYNKANLLAGFDGFSENVDKNYVDASYQNERHITEFKELNDELAKMFGEIVETMSPGKFQSIISICET